MPIRYIAPSNPRRAGDRRADSILVFASSLHLPRRSVWRQRARRLSKPYAPPSRCRNIAELERSFARRWPFPTTASVRPKMRFELEHGCSRRRPVTHAKYGAGAATLNPEKLRHRRVMRLRACAEALASDYTELELTKRDAKVKPFEPSTPPTQPAALVAPGPLPAAPSVASSAWSRHEPRRHYPIIRSRRSLAVPTEVAAIAGCCSCWDLSRRGTLLLNIKHRARISTMFASETLCRTKTCVPVGSRTRKRIKR